MSPYESSQFVGYNRKITQRGSAALRKAGYETMKFINTHPRLDDTVYQYVIEKEAEGKAKKAAKIAGLNKFLRTYYAQVKEVYADS